MEKLTLRGLCVYTYLVVDQLLSDAEARIN